MKDDTGRPGSGDKGLPAGTRARNRTMIIGAERVSTLGATVERATPIEPLGSRGEPHARDFDPLGLDTLEQDEFVTPVSHHDDFQSLDEIFGTMHEGARATEPQETVERVTAGESGSKDASSTLMSDLGLDDDFQSVLDVFEPPAATSGQVAAPKIVRSPSGNLNPPVQVVATDLFDPFAAMENEEEPRDPQMSAETSPVLRDSDLEETFEDVSNLDPVIEESPTTPTAVREDERAVPNERLIIPPSLHQTAGPAVPSGEGQVFPSELKTSTYQEAPDAELMSEPRDQIYWKSESPLVGFLVTYDHDSNGTYVELRQGRLMVSNQREDSGNCLVVVGDSVSPMHAIMRVAAGGSLQVLDQLSESGTRVKRVGQREEEFLSGEKSSLSHGDVLFFGDRKFHVLLVVGEVEEG